MKKTLAIMLCLIMAVSLLAGCGSDNSASTGTTATASGEKVLKIGIFEPLTGDNGAGGKKEALGVQYANSLNPTVEVNGETYTVELVIADNESSSDKAISAATQLVSEGCNVIVGSYGSGVSMAAADTFESNGVAAIGISCTNAGVTAGNNNYFRICFIDPDQGTIDANLVKSMGYTKAYVLSMLGEDYGTGLANNFVEAAGPLGIEVVQETFPENNTDFSSYLNNAVASGAQAIFCPCSTVYAQQIIAQEAAAGINIPLFAGDTWDDGQISQAAAAANAQFGIYCSTFYADGADPEFEAAIKSWIESDNTNLTNNGGDTQLSAVTVLGYDVYNVVLEAVKAAGSVDKADILAALPGVVTNGVTGEIKFKDGGDADRHNAFIKQFDAATGTLTYYDLFTF